MSLANQLDALLGAAADRGDVPGVVAMITDRSPGLPKSWSMACQILGQTAPTGLPAGSLIWGGQANSYFWIDPVNGIAGVFLTQILPFMDHKALPLFLDFQHAVYQAH